MAMDINLSRISALQGEYATVEAEIESWQTYAYRTGKNVDKTIAALEQRLIDINALIIRSQGGSNGYKPATPLEYGLVKYDDDSIKMNSNGQLYANPQSTIFDVFREADAVISGRVLNLENRVSTLESYNLNSRLTNAETNIASQGARISTLESNITNYLPITGGTISGVLRVNNSSNLGYVYFGSGTNYIVANTAGDMAIRSSTGLVSIQNSTRNLITITANNNYVSSVDLLSKFWELESRIVALEG